MILLLYYTFNLILESYYTLIISFIILITNLMKRFFYGVYIFISLKLI